MKLMRDEMSCRRVPTSFLTGIKYDVGVSLAVSSAEASQDSDVGVLAEGFVGVCTSLIRKL